MFAPRSRGRRAMLAALALGAFYAARPASAVSAGAFCSSAAAPRGPVRVPSDFESEVAKTFNIPIEMVRDGAFVRCSGRRLLACAVGANLNCGKANLRRSLPGATAFCRANPDADVVPMAATGHDTIYDWRCVGRRAVAGKAVVAVDAEGYDAGNWKEVGR